MRKLFLKPDRKRVVPEKGAFPKNIGKNIQSILWDFFLLTAGSPKTIGNRL
jgi:hypothetical protein